MKRIFFLGSLLLIVMSHLVGSSTWSNGEASCTRNGVGHANPADFYCVELGYEVEVIETEKGQQGICIFPDGSNCDTWQFFEGKGGENFSYCAQHGYGQITKADGQDPYSQDYTVCVDIQTGEEIGSVTKLMGLVELFSRGTYPPLPQLQLPQLQLPSDVPQDLPDPSLVEGAPPEAVSVDVHFTIPPEKNYGWVYYDYYDAEGNLISSVRVCGSPDYPSDPCKWSISWWYSRLYDPNGILQPNQVYDPNGILQPNLRRRDQEGKLYLAAEELIDPNDLPSSFDWRNKDGKDFMTSVKNQSLCGSCWAFSAVGTVEAKYNIAMKNPDPNRDLSEEYLVSDPNMCGCCSGFYRNAFKYIKDHGIPDEECLPYDVKYYSTRKCMCDPNYCSDDPNASVFFSCFNKCCDPNCTGLQEDPPTCSHEKKTNTCVDVEDRLVKIDNYNRVPAVYIDTSIIRIYYDRNNIYYDRNNIKDKLINKGPLAASLSMIGDFDENDNNIYKCTNTKCWDLNNNSECDPNGICDPNIGKCESGLTGHPCSSDYDCGEDKSGRWVETDGEWKESKDGKCDDLDCLTNHDIILVGYNDKYKYWIAKNSWGLNWPDPNIEDGYFKIGYGECYIEWNVSYIDLSLPIADAGGPYVAEGMSSGMGIFTLDVRLDGTGSIDPKGGALTYSWSATCPKLGLPIRSPISSPISPLLRWYSCSFDDPTSPTPELKVKISNISSSYIHLPIEFSVSLTVTDDSGNSDTNTTSVSIKPQITPPPIFSRFLFCPSDITINCDESTHESNTGLPHKIGQWCDSVSYTYSDATTTGTCPDEFTIIRTWTATDDCGNSRNCEQTIEVVDTAPPEITCPTDVYGTIIDLGNPTVSDNCDMNPNVTNDAPATFPSGKTIVTWTATDACGNSSSCTQTVVRNLPPIADAGGPYVKEYQFIPLNLTIPVPLDGTGSSDPEGGALTYSWSVICPKLGLPISPPISPPIGWDSCSFDDPTSPTPELRVNTSNISSPYISLPIVCSVSLTVTDDSGNTNTDTTSVSIMLKFIIQPTIPQPTIPRFLFCPSDITINCDESTRESNTGIPHHIGTWCDSVSYSYSDTTTLGPCPDEFTIVRTWKAADDCGKSRNCEQTIEVVDTAPPEITCPTDVDGTTVYLGNPTVFDNCDVNPNIELAFTLGETIVTWTATDACGNSSSCTQTVTVSDTKPPNCFCIGIRSLGEPQ